MGFRFWLSDLMLLWSGIIWGIGLAYTILFSSLLDLVAGFVFSAVFAILSGFFRAWAKDAGEKI